MRQEDRTIWSGLSILFAILPFSAYELRAVFVRLLAYVSGIGICAVFGIEMMRTPVVASVEPIARAEWIDVSRPHAAFALTLPGVSEEPRYSITRHVEGGGRKDMIVFGDPGRSLRTMVVEIYRPGDELERFSDPASEIAARTGALGLAGAVKTALPIETKFGTMSAMDFMIGPFGTGHCVGFQRLFDNPKLQISGFACSMNSLVSREGIACALDRLTLLSSGNDPAIAGVFARAELNRTFCGQRDVILAATPKRPGDVGRTEVVVKLRGGLSAQ